MFMWQSEAGSCNPGCGEDEVWGGVSVREEGGVGEEGGGEVEEESVGEEGECGGGRGGCEQRGFGRRVQKMCMWVWKCGWGGKVWGAWMWRCGNVGERSGVSGGIQPIKRPLAKEIHLAHNFKNVNSLDAMLVKWESTQHEKVES